MCLAIPMKIKNMNGCEATCEAGGIEKDIRIDLIEDAAVGDYVMVHAGFAIEKNDRATGSGKHPFSGGNWKCSMKNNLKALSIPNC